MKRRSLLLHFYSVDLGPARNLALLSNEALRRGHRVVCVGNTEIPSADVETMLFKHSPDAIVLGLASFCTKTEVRALDLAQQFQLPAFVLSDVHGAFARPLAKGHVKEAIALVSSGEEITQARKFGYRDAVMFIPPLWKEWMGKEQQYTPGEQPFAGVYVYGNKCGQMMDKKLSKIVLAGDRVWGRGNWKLMFDPHPNESGGDKAWRSELIASFPVLQGDVPLIPIYMAGGTYSIRSAYTRTPALCIYNDPDVRADLRKSGIDSWFVSEKGAIRNVGTVRGDSLYKTLRELVDGKFNRNIHRAQERYFPHFASDRDPAREILDYLETKCGA